MRRQGAKEWMKERQTSPTRLVGFVKSKRDVEERQGSLSLRYQCFVLVLGTFETTTTEIGSPSSLPQSIRCLIYISEAQASSIIYTMSSLSPACTPLRVADLPTVFSDLTPLAQDDDSKDYVVVARIDYTADFAQAYDYMRAVWKADERSSLRALQLSVTCLQLNPANYTVWQFRRACLDRLYFNKAVDSKAAADASPRMVLELLPADADPQADAQQVVRNELQLASRLGGDNPKNYQIWHHRRAMLERLLVLKNIHSDDEEQQPAGDSLAFNRHKLVLSELGPSELTYVNGVLEIDAKNYHAWSYRQWLVRSMMMASTSSTTVIPSGNNVTVMESELTYAKQLLVEDCRNNSAWNHLWFLLHLHVVNTNDNDATATNAKKCLSASVAQNYASYALQQAQDDEFNESPWRFLVAIVKEQVKQGNNFKFLDHQIQDVQDMYQQDRYRHCHHVLSTLSELLEWQGTNLASALQLTQELEQQDLIRRKYWRLRQEQIQKKIKGLALERTTVEEATAETE
jgi:protein farnesyltransferase/geranylgeranyltransferase type-1 subunit alpha